MKPINCAPDPIWRLLFYVRIRLFKWGLAAVDSHFICSVQENDFCRLLKNFKTQHDFIDRCAMHVNSMFKVVEDSC